MELLLLGAGGHGRVVKEIAESLRDQNGQKFYEEVAFLDDHSQEAIGTFAELSKYRNRFGHAFAAVGNDRMRMELITQIEQEGFHLPVLISPEAYVSPKAVLGAGTVVEPMAVVNTGTVIGKGCIVSIGALIDHDTVIEEGVHISCGTIVKADCYITGNQTIPSGNVCKKNDYGKRMAVRDAEEK